MYNFPPNIGVYSGLGMTFTRYIREKVTGLGIVSTLSTYIGAVVGLDYLYSTYWAASNNATPVVWAGSVTFGIYLFVGLLNYCWFAQMIMQEEIDRITSVKARLEAQILKKRQSSKKR